MGRKISLITTDQQRHEALGCTGGTVARTPAIDPLAGLAAPDWMQTPLPTHEAANHGHERTVTECQDVFAGQNVTMRTLYRDGYICTVYK